MRHYYNMSLRNLANRLRKYKDNLPTQLDAIIEDEAAYIVDCIREQLSAGQDGMGNNISLEHPYAASTIIRRTSRGLPAHIVTLYETGEFYKGFYLTRDPAGYYVTSSDRKVKFLVAKYGNVIFRLNRDNFNELVRRVREKLKVSIYG